jgi:signal transduction histidine kinase
VTFKTGVAFETLCVSGVRATIVVIRPYILAALTVVLAYAVKSSIQPYISTSPPFITFLVAIMFTAWKWGFRPAAFATVLSAIVIDYWLIPPANSFALGPADFGTLLIFSLVGTAMAYFIHRQEQARHEAVTFQGQLQRLHKLSTRLLGEEKFEALLQRVLTAAVELPKADKGTLQLYEPKANLLHMVAQVGFNGEFLHRFQRLPLDFASCGAAYQRQRRVIIENVATDPEFSRLAPLFSTYQLVSAQSTPLFAADREVLGVLTTYSREAGVPTDEQLRILDLYADQAGRIIEVKQKETELRLNKLDLETQVIEGEQRLRDIAAELAITEERERRALASELHDYLAQLLTLGHIKLKLAQQFLGSSPGQSERYMQETAEALQRSLQYARTLMAELVPPELHESGLPAAIRWLAGQMAKHGLTVDLRLDVESVALTHDQAVLLYKCVRELLINVVKHAAVVRATVALSVDPDQRLLIMVEDHGRGYDPASIKTGGVGGHFGLASIRERLAAIGGWLTEESAIGGGATMTLGLSVAESGKQRPLRAASSSIPQDGVKTKQSGPANQAGFPFENSPEEREADGDRINHSATTPDHTA